MCIEDIVCLITGVAGLLMAFVWWVIEPDFMFEEEE